MTKKWRGTAPRGACGAQVREPKREERVRPFPTDFFLPLPGSSRDCCVLVFPWGDLWCCSRCAVVRQGGRARLQSTFSKEAVAGSLYPRTVRRVPTGYVIYAWLGKAYLSGAARATLSPLW